MVDSTASQPLVSIVLPTYKRAHLLAGAIRSVLSQSYTNWELIIVDDNSPDDTPDVVKSFDDARIRYTRNEPNLKLPRALNKGFSLARGDYLTWTSDDNFYADNAIEKMVARLQAGGCDLVYADYYHFSVQDEAGRPLDVRHDKLPDTLQLARSNHIGACFLYTRQVHEQTGDYDPELFLVEDYDFFMRASKRFQFCHLPEPLYYFRRDDDTLFLSRFSEVKASDFLARYKNGLLSEDALLEDVVALLLRNCDGLTNPLLRWPYRLFHKTSFRLAQMHLKLTAAYLRKQLQARVPALLRAYASQQASFGETRDALRNLINQLGRIEYVRP